MLNNGIVTDPSFGNFFRYSTTTPGIGASTTDIARDVASTLFSGILSLFNQILPYAIGVLIFYIGYRFARRALGGR